MNRLDMIITEGQVDFKGFLEEVLGLVIKDAIDTVSETLEALDEEISRSGEMRGWESVGKRVRKLSTLWGMEIVVRRRGYRRAGSRGLRFPLDELLGLAEGEKYCPLVKAMGLDLGAKMSFREASSILGKHVRVEISHERVHQWVQEAGEQRSKEQEGEDRKLAETGEVQVGRRKAEVVVIETDGTFVSLQREGRRKDLELKLGVIHEGWQAESPAGKRFRLVNKTIWGGKLDSEEFWTRGQKLYYGQYEEVGTTAISGDGADWIKAGTQYIDGSRFYLDRYHIQQAITRGVGWDRNMARQIRQSVRYGHLDELERVLDAAAAVAPEQRELERVQQLADYLLGNRDHLQDWRKVEKLLPNNVRGLGAAEGQINHVLAARMTKRGMSWRVCGAHRMAQLRYLQAEGRLQSWVSDFAGKGWQSVQAQVAEKVIGRLKRANGRSLAQQAAQCLPILAGRYATTPLGRTLKRISTEALALT